MSQPTITGAVIDGIFAINKPPGKSSAQVIRDLQSIFKTSRFFARTSQDQVSTDRHDISTSRRRAKSRRQNVKIGHGGTLDPMATGVLVLGIGSGTKLLGNFLDCTKSYEATVLFGAATDSYDTDGKVLRRASSAQLTPSKVTEALSPFRGKTMQRPPLYSAIKMNGKRLCDYAREGKDIPREIATRPVVVEELELMKWLPPGSHSFSLPRTDADAEVINVAENLLHLGEISTSPVEPLQEAACFGSEAATSLKRKRSLDRAEIHSDKHARSSVPQEPTATHDQETSSQDQSAVEVDQPAAKLGMTVSSGFYVRSLAHDLGEAVGSLACMCALTRTRQAGFELGKNVLEYEEFQKSEDIWSGLLRDLLRKDVTL